jgi:hypothetical protein
MVDKGFAYAAGAKVLAPDPWKSLLKSLLRKLSCAPAETLVESKTFG